MTVRFIHIRSSELPYLQDTSEHFGGITVAYELWTAKDQQDASHLFANVGLAICDFRDRYNKTTGRTVALSRLQQRVHMPALLAFTTQLGYAAPADEVGVGVGKYMPSFYASLSVDALGGIDVNEREIKVTQILRRAAITNGEHVHYDWK